MNATTRANNEHNNEQNDIETLAQRVTEIEKSRAIAPWCQAAGLVIGGVIGITLLAMTVD